MSKAERARNRRRREAGFSLVEALVTVFIIGLMAGAVVLLMPGPDQKTREFAEHFAARVTLASEESILSNHAHALVVNGDGYGFERLEESGWRLISHGSPLAFRPWPEDISYRVEQSEFADESERVARFDVFGAASPARIIVDGAGARLSVEIDGQGRAHVSRIR
jgi:general secretion pathway protein H